MDLVTAKTLVSAATVFVIGIFSIISFEMAFRSVAGDLKTVWSKRVDTGAADRVKSSAAS